MSYPVTYDVPHVPRVKGRKKGSRNLSAPERDKAIIQAKVYFDSGMTKIESARKVCDEFAIIIQPDTLARLI